MNTCVLMAKVISNPELRYTPDNQTEVAQMLVEFEGRRKEDAPCTLKVVGWGGLATQMKESCTEGDRLILEGRLAMNTFERKEGFKEKRAELVISRFYPLDGLAESSSADNVVSFDAAKSSHPMDNSYDEDDYDMDESEEMGTSSTNEADDPIPF
ncbi:putative YCF41 [Crocosphaera subtropica ATCC 51142]|uniref:YCF41 n=1 Tax=Crocosphaera subtropica (strain ATCC 51142 / BH68) TaxID=43989 RepID=B1WPI0_CROS5|nr:single-stranded DNA-binding protein [Crocosphaera subtropica]ACB51550.1 putative YCF41 [Crocosphaera subtropica ATCC 51142]